MSCVSEQRSTQGAPGARPGAVQSFAEGSPRVIVAGATGFAGALAALPAMATPITFTVSDTATGILNDSSFLNALVTFTEVTDMTLIANCPVSFIPAPQP